MDQFTANFYYSDIFNLVICRVHGQGIVASRFQSHLSGKHKGLAKATQREVLAAAVSQFGSSWMVRDIDVIYPSQPPLPLPSLEVFKDGRKCNTQGCGLIRRTDGGIQEHCHDKHNWKNGRRKGKQPRNRNFDRPWTEDVWCQKFQPSGTLGQLFEISQAGKEEEVEPAMAEQEVQRIMELSLIQATQGLEKAQKEKEVIIQADSNRFEWNTWLDRVGWARHLDKLNAEWLLEQIRQPEEHETGLDALDRAVEMVIWKAQQASKSSIVGMPAMMFVNRRESGNNTNEKPFNARQTGKTMDKYSLRWMEVIRYIWRTHKLLIVSQQNISRQKERRPAYRLTGRQEIALQRIKMVVSEDKSEDSNFSSAFSSEESTTAMLEVAADIERLEELALELMLSLLDHQLKDEEYESALVSGMAVLGISGDCGGWISPLSYTPKIAAIVNVSRMLVLYQSTKIRQSETSRLVNEGLEQQEAEAQAPSHFELVQAMVRQFMTLVEFNGKPTPIDTLQRMKAFGLKIRTDTIEEGVIDWIGDTLLYGKIQFSMPQLRSMVHGLIASTRQHLVERLMLRRVNMDGDVIDRVPMPVINWDKLVDNAAEQRVGWSFMQDDRNRSAIDAENPENWLPKQIVNEKRLRREFVDVGRTQTAVRLGQNTVIWNEDRIDKFGRDIKAFRQMLLVAVHFTGGLPARSTELITVQFRNSFNGEGRGIFIEDGLVVFVIIYHKNIGMSGKSKVIHRYLPREVGELMVYYLWFVLPFWEKLESAMKSKTVISSSYIWEPELEKEWAMPQRKRLRVDENGGYTVEEEEEDEEGFAEEELSSVETWNSNRVSYAIQKITLEHMGVKIGILPWRHSVTAIVRRYIHNKLAVNTTVQANRDESDVEDEAFDLQTGHSSKIGGMIYGRPITEGLFSTEQKRANFREVSTEWHSFLQMPSTLESKPRKGTQAAAVRREAIQEEYRRWKMMKLVDTKDALKQLVGKQAEFRSVQEPALQAIMQQKSPVVVIMGTGAGKSILFMLPASVSSGITIVIVPLVSLREDMKTRCDKLGIACVEWNSRKPGEWAQVVLVTPESAVSEGFRHFINRQRSMGRIDRIVVDECHVVLDSVGGWRERIMELRSLIILETQLVYLTATLRPSEEQNFIQLMGLPAKECCHWFRGSTTRANICYQICRYDIDKEEEEVSDLVEKLKEKYPLPGQIIVYCDTVDRTKQLAEVLGCVCYHRNVGNAQEKKELLQMLTSGVQQVFTATNALGLGIDAPTIRAVIHIGTVRLIRQYAQESGRAGRDGKASEAIIMRGFRSTHKGNVNCKLHGSVEPEMKEFIEGSDCMRAVLERAMDGKEDRIECEEGEVKCQQCQQLEDEIVSMAQDTEEITSLSHDDADEREAADYAEFQRLLSLRRSHAVAEVRHQANNAIQVNELIRLMEEWKEGCQQCRAYNIAGSGHNLEQCRHEEAESMRGGLEFLQKQIQWAKYSCCFDCGLPQSICSSFQLDIVRGGYRKQAGLQCQYKGVLIKVVVAIWYRYTEQVEEIVREILFDEGRIGRGGRGLDDETVFATAVVWLGEKKRWGGIEGNKMCWFLCRVSERLGL